MKIRFAPLKDITAYELATIYMGLVLSPLTALKNTVTSITPEQWDDLSPGVQRHFEVVL